HDLICKYVCKVLSKQLIILIYNLFLFNNTATTELYTLSLHDALPICAGAGARSARREGIRGLGRRRARPAPSLPRHQGTRPSPRSEEHTSELQSLAYLVCRLLLEKKNKSSENFMTMLVIYICESTNLL